MSVLDAFSLLESGKPIILKCQSTTHNPQYLYLDGVTTVGGVSLSPTTTGMYTGTHWMPEKLKEGTYLLRCLSNTVSFNYTYLSGKPDSWVHLCPSNHMNDSMYWKIENIPAHSESVALKCMHTGNGVYLDGLTDAGAVKLSPSTDKIYSGTHWKLGVTEYTPVYVRRILHHYYADLNISCFPIQGSYKQVELTTLHHIWDQTDLSHHDGDSSYYSSNDTACSLKTAVSDWFYKHDQSWAQPVLCGIMWGTESGDYTMKAINFTIDAFSELVLFNPLTGEKILTENWKPSICVY